MTINFISNREKEKKRGKEKVLFGNRGQTRRKKKGKKEAHPLMMQKNYANGVKKRGKRGGGMPS